MEELLAYLDQSIIVAHHANFDRQMIDAALARLGAGRLRNPFVDTANLAKRVQPPTHYVSEERYGLDQLALLYGIPLQDRHTALGDAYITALLFLKLVAKLKGKGKFSLGDLLRKHRLYYR
jgi:DNA polymerase-3 subunit epsilon